MSIKESSEKCKLPLVDLNGNVQSRRSNRQRSRTFGANRAVRLSEDLLSDCVYFFTLYTNASLGLTSLKNIINDPSYTQFAAKTADLKLVDPTILNPHQLTTFWLNIHNLLVLHTHIERIELFIEAESTLQSTSLLSGDSKLERVAVQYVKSFLDIISTTRYVFFNGVTLNALDIEFSILRAKSFPADSGPFAASRFRQALLSAHNVPDEWQCQHPEPMVSFLITYLTQSSPPLIICRYDTVRETFQLATRLFLENSVKIRRNDEPQRRRRSSPWLSTAIEKSHKESSKQRTRGGSIASSVELPPKRYGSLVLPTVLKWYTSDFGATQAEEVSLLQWVFAHVGQAKADEIDVFLEDMAIAGRNVKVEFDDYNWRFNYTFMPTEDNRHVVRRRSHSVDRHSRRKKKNKGITAPTPPATPAHPDEQHTPTPLLSPVGDAMPHTVSSSHDSIRTTSSSGGTHSDDDDDDDADADDDDSGQSDRHASRAHSSPFTATLKPQQSTSSTTTHALNTSIESIPSPPRSHERHEELTNANVDIPPPDRSSLLTARKKPPAKLASTKSDPYAEVRRLARLEKSSLRSSAKKAARATCTSGQFASSATYSSDDRRVSTDDSDSDSSLNRHKRTASAGGLEEILKKLPMPSSPIPVSSDGGSQRRRTSQFLSSSLGEQKEEELWRRFSAPVSFILPPELRGDNNYEEVIVSPLSAGGSVERTHAFNNSPDVHQLSPGTMLPRSEPRAVAQGVDVMTERRRQNRDLFTSSAPIPFAPMNNNKGRNRTSSVVEEQYAFAARQALAKSTGGLTPPAFANDRKFMTMTVGSMPRSFGTRPRAGSRTNVDVRRMVQQRDATMPLSASPSFLPASFGGRHRRNTDNPRRIIPQTRRQSKSDRPKDSPKRVEVMRRSQSKPADWTPKVLPRAESDRTVHFDRVWYTTSQTHSRHNSLHRSDSLTDELSKTAATDTRAIQIAALKRAQEKLTNMLKKARVRAKHSQLLKTAKRPSFSATQPILSPSVTAPVPKRTRSPSVSSALKPPDKQVKSVVFSSSAPGEILTKSNETQKSLESGQSQESSTASTASARRRKRLLKRRTSAPEHQSMTKLSAGIDYEMLTHELRSMKERSNIDIDLIIDELKVKIEHADATHRLIYQSFKDLCREYYETSADAYVVHHDRFRSLLHRLQQKAAPNDDPVNRVVARLLFVLSPIGRLLRLLALRGPSMTDAERRRAREARRVSVAAMSNNAPPPELDSNGELASGDMDMCFESMSSDERGLDSSEEASTGRARAYSAGHTLNSAEQMAMLEDSPEHDSILSTSVSAMQPETMLPLVCRICDERMLATAGNFELHTTLCAEAQQIADNIEASTDERIVLLMRHVKRRLPQSRQRNKALPILNHLQDAAINCRYGDEAAAEKLQALVEQLRTLLSETVEEKLALYTFGSRILALMEEKSEALSQVAQAARDGRSIWGVLSLLPSTDAVAPPPAARSKSLMSLNFNPDDSDATETDDADTDDKHSTNEPSPRLPPNAPQPHEGSDSKRADSPFGKRNSEPHGSPLNLSRLPQSGKFRKPGSALSSPRMGSPRVSSPRKGPSIEDFTLIKPISAGGFGKVFLGKKNTTGDIYAIKVIYKSSLMRKNLVDQAIAERNIMAATDNPFVVKLFFAFESETKLYFVMEYVIGGDCASLLNALGCFDIEMSKRYIAETTLALRYLHSLGVIHRDLKPDNMLINENGHIVLTDFGLSEVGVIEQQDSAPPSLLNVSARKTSVSSPSLPTSPADARQLVRAVSSSVLPPTSPASRRLAASGVRGSPLRKSTSLRAGHQPLASSDTDATHQSNDTTNDNDNAQNDANNNSVFESNDFVKLNVSDGCRKSPRKVVVFSVHEPIVLTTRGETMLFEPNVSSSASTTPSDTPRDGARRSFSTRTSNLGASVEYGGSTDDSGATQRDSSGDRKDSDAFDANAGLFALDDEGHEERKASSDTLTASGLKRSTSSEVMSPTDRLQQLNLSGSLNQSMKLSRSALSQLPMDDGSPNNDDDDDDDIELTNRGERRSSTLRVAASSQDVSRHLSNSRDDESGGSVVIHDNVDDNIDGDDDVESSSGSIDLLDGGNRRILRTASFSTSNVLDEENDDDDDDDDGNGESKSDDNDGDDERESDGDERGSEDASAFTSGSSAHGRVNTSATSSSTTTSTSSTSDSDDETVSFISRRKSARPATHRIRGTPDYLAPEIVLGSEHAAPVDWWALGVILFEFLVGIPPFNADTREAIQERILSRHVPWEDLPDDECDEHTMDLLRRLLTYSPDHRLGANGAEEIMAHPFFKGTDWDTLYSRHDDVPFTPAPSDDLDTSYFIPRAGQMSMSLDTASAAKPLKVPRFRGALDEDVDRRAARHKLDDGENDDNDVTDQDDNGNNMSQLSPASRRQLALFGRTFSFTNVSNLSQKNKESAKSIHRSLKLQKASLAMSQSSLKSGEFSPRLSPRSGNNSPRDTSPRVTASNSVQISPRSDAGTSSLAHSSPAITPAASPGIAAPSPKLDRLSRAPSSLRASARRSTMEESDSCSEDNTSTQSQSLLSTSDKLTHKSSLAAQSFKHSPSDNESSSPRSASNTPGRASLTASSSTPRPNVK